MMKKIFIFAMSLFCFTASTVSLARPCPQPFPIGHPAFCTSFQQAAACQCENRGLSSLVCQHMNLIYSAMLARYTYLATACTQQHDTTPQMCIDEWSCYMTGKMGSGAWCNATHRAC